MRLFHFSEDPTIAHFIPRPVATPAMRPPGREWLNGPLVWGIDEWHQPMYLFPRDCPRILIWPTAATTDADRRDRWGTTSHRMIAYIERHWMPTLGEATLYKYELPIGTFQNLDDAGMWVSSQTVVPYANEPIGDLLRALHREDVELRVVERLTSLRGLWSTSVHVSGIRLHNAAA